MAEDRTGGNAWRKDPRYGHIAGRHEMAGLYDHKTTAGVAEVDSVAGSSHLEHALDTQLMSAIRNELSEPLPTRIKAAQHDGYADYYTTAKTAALIAAAQRRTLEEKEPASNAAEKLGAQ